VGAMVRANDKVKRLQKLAKEGKLSNESARDSFMDLAVYALLALILFEEVQGATIAKSAVDSEVDPGHGVDSFTGHGRSLDPFGK
jgi:hypothetical protein